MRNTRVHYFVHGRGRGHATRSLAIIDRLRAHGVTGTVFAGDDAAPLVAASLDGVAGWGCVPIRSIPPRPSWAGLVRTGARVTDGWRTIRRDSPDVVISDGDHPGVVAGRASGRPVIAVGHGLVFSECRRPAYLPRAPWRREAMKARLSSWPASAYVAVNFVPLEARSSATSIARPPLGFDATTAPPGGAPDTIVAYFAEGLDERVVPLLRRALPTELELILFGTRPHPDLDVRRIDRAGFLTELARCRAVVASAGSQLISECVALGRPVFAIYDPRHDEQALNVGMLRAHRLGDGCSWDELDETRLAHFARASPDRFARSTWQGPDAADEVLRRVQEVAA